MPRAVRIPLFLLATLAWDSCTYARTQTIIETRADRLVEIQASELRLEVFDSATTALLLSRSVNPQALDFVGFPLTLPVSSRQRAENRFEVRVTAFQTRRQPDGSVLVSTLAHNRVRTSFVRGRVSQLTLWLLSTCRCNSETERCVPDADQDLVPECLPIDVDIRTTLDGGFDLDAGDAESDAPTDGVATDAACTAAQRMCGTQCVSRLSPLFCGPGCVSCPQVAGGAAQCNNDQCDVTCEARTPDRCPTAGTTVMCVDLASDRLHCGTCDRECPGNQLCVAAQCVDPPECSAENNPCVGTTYCDLMLRRCVPGCDSQAQCRSDQMCNVASHTCECNSDRLACGDLCVTCPTGGAIESVGCANGMCAVLGCAPGYTINSAQTGCDDINECLTMCPAPATCTNTPAGSFTCRCSNPNRRCGGGCVTCPDDPNATDTECSGDRCIVTGCQDGYTRNADRTGCTPVTLGPWTYQATRSILTRPSGTGAMFGLARSLALSRDGLVLAVGDKEFGSGQLGGVHIYTRSSTSGNFGPVPQQTLSPPATGSDFGTSVAFTSDASTLVVGDYNHGSAQLGAVHFYTRSGPTGMFAAAPTTTLASPLGGGLFGGGISLSNDDLTLVVGDVSFSPAMTGGVHVYTRANTSAPFTMPQTIVAPPGSLDFGFAVALSADGLELFVGDPEFAPRGVVHRFIRSATNVPFVTPLDAITGPAGAVKFGASIAFGQSGLAAAIGDWEAGTGMLGNVFAYTRTSTALAFGVATQTLLGPMGSGETGISLTMTRDGRELFVGDDGSTGGTGPGRGAVLVFRR